MCYNILVKRLRDNLKIKDGKRKMTEKEKRDEIIKIRKKFYELFENIDLDEITLFAKYVVSMKKHSVAVAVFLQGHHKVGVMLKR